MNKRRTQIQGWLFASPYLLFSLVFFLVPLIASILLTITNWNLISPSYDIIGVDNFIKALKSPKVHAAFFVSYKFMIMLIPLVLLLSLGLAMLVNSLPKYRDLFLVGYFLPYLSSGVSTALVIKGFFSYNGFLNIWLRSRGITINWLGSPNLTPFVISLMIAWKFSGYYTLILTSGLESIPKEIYESAKIDGASGWTTFWKITIPMLYPALYSVIILSTGLVFGIFTEPYLLTKGGPNLNTHTWQLEIYSQAFERLNAGYGSAIAIIAAIVTFITIYIIRTLLEKWGEKYGWE